jgi:hypothetical protein
MSVEIQRHALEQNFASIRVAVKPVPQAWQVHCL